MIDIEGIKNVLIYLKKERLAINDAEFAKKIGKQRSYISEIRTGKRNITEQFVLQIHNAFPIISLDWLLKNEGEMILDNTKNDTNKDTYKMENKFYEELILSQQRIIENQTKIILEMQDKKGKENVPRGDATCADVAG